MIEFHNEAEVEIDGEELITLARFVMDTLNLHPDTELGLTLVTEPAMSVLHEEWLGEPGPTDVMSFPMDELRPGRPDAKTPEGILGDIVLCPEFAAAQAAAQGHTLREELVVLTTHGMLHLLGFDHAHPLDEARMFGLQKQLVEEFWRRQAAFEGTGE